VGPFSTTCFFALLAALAFVFIAREAATYKGIIRVKYIATPLVTALVAGIAVLSIADHGYSGYRALVLSALVLSLVGDTMLMIVEVNLLPQGIVYFLSAHVLYIIAFSMDYSFKSWNIIPAVILAAVLVFFYKNIRGRTSGLDVPILIYATVVLIMLYFAVSSVDPWFGMKSLCIVSGAMLFVISDFVLAYFAFIRPYQHASVITWSLYFPAQLLLSLSCFG
jgi:uncharacterized membrane protein YhhN